VLIYAGINGFLDALSVETIVDLEHTLYEKLSTTYASLAEMIVSEKTLNDSIEEEMKKVIVESVDEVK
jgi:F0F1-type ATP synthase alpha subunit